MKLGAQELREIDENEAKKVLRQAQDKSKRRPVYFILEDVLDTYNIGGLFRLADALAIEKIYLCGQTETPPNHRIKKASVGTYKVVPWEHCKTATNAILSLRAKRGNPKKEIASTRKGGSRNDNNTIQVIAIEQHKKAVDYRKIEYSLPMALIVGNETDGVSQKTLEKCDKIVEIPMWGINKSLNVIVSAAIVGYHAVLHEKHVV